MVGRVRLEFWVRSTAALGAVFLLLGSARAALAAEEADESSGESNADSKKESDGDGDGEKKDDSEDDAAPEPRSESFGHGGQVGLRLGLAAATESF
jgi:hypothetical protein